MFAAEKLLDKMQARSRSYVDRKIANNPIYALVPIDDTQPAKIAAFAIHSLVLSVGPEDCFAELPVGGFLTTLKNADDYVA